MHQILRIIICLALLSTVAFGQTAARARAELGSQTARAGFKNEDEIRDKFNNWRLDEDARVWLAAMNYRLNDIESVTAAKPHGEKADVEVSVKTRQGERKEGISIKLVSSATGFNQIDKRWLSTYAKKWKMPARVETALKYFVGETPPYKPSRSENRMYLNELDPADQKAVVDFLTAKKDEIVSDLFEGDGVHAAGWVMVALKASDKPQWALRSSSETIKFFSEGPVVLTRGGSLKIGRITMQRKGGDGGRDTAKMLQFKINPALLIRSPKPLGQ